MINFKLDKKINLEGYTFLEGFPGVGLVGSMTISYIIEKLKMESIGYLESSDFPPLISIHKNIPMSPIRIYVSEKKKLISIFAEFSIPIGLTHELSDKLFSFIKEQKISKIISISGIPIAKDQSDEQNKDIENNEVFFVASDENLIKSIENLKIKPINEGISSGLNALLLFKSVVEKISDISILVPIDPSIVDPKYAEIAIKSINKLIELNIDTDELEKEAKSVESKLKTIITKGKETHDQYKKAIEDAGPSMYE